MPPSDHRFAAIGTEWRITTEEPLPNELVAAVEDRAERFDAAYSRFRDDSLVALLARDGGSVELPADAEELLDVYARLYRATDRALTPLVGGSLERLGYDAAYSLAPSGPPVASPAWEDRLRVEGTTVTVAEPTLLDFGAAGKGRLVDLLLDELAANGIDAATVDGSGDLRHSGAEPLLVGLEHPYDPARAIGVVEVRDGALCASATNRRAWGDGMHHVLDGRTGLPVRSVAATWVLAPTAVVADGLATALFFADPARLREEFDFRHVRMFTDGSADFSPDLPGEVFSA